LSIPLDKLIDKDVNVYEMTCVAIKEAAIVASNKEAEEELENNHDKVVSSVLSKVLNDEIEYTPVET
jgi:DNA-directed RNA polymerase subunit omega